ncbi:glycosyltransferase family 4 protein [Hydrogenophaga sp.]|jgi:glycosyltransferase involved in cell wall biosynthesis|uniref:glycosyltransferase family 4 protein n=1 Tax=Hydrogenophaga sp. TaxID=1904254 RepID=UPI003F6E80DF
MHVLLLSFYFPPDLSAGSFRMEALVTALQERLGADSRITVITTRPNRYGSFEAQAPATEVRGGLTVHRIDLPAHQSGMRDQVRAFATFAWKARSLVARERPDVVVATTSRLMTGVLGAWAARNRGAPLYLDTRDIFVDTIGDVLPRRATWLIKPLFSALEKWAVRSATRVNLVSPGFLPYFQPRYPDRTFSVLSNGVDDAFLQHRPEQLAQSQKAPGPIHVLYAGNLGEGQGLHHILPALAQTLGDEVRFTVVGDGGRRAQLESALATLPRHGVTLLAPVKRSELIALYNEADVLFVHLNDLPAFEKVLPSKLFEYAATGKPIWAGLAGFPAQFTQKEIENAAVFNPCDAAGAVAAFRTLRLHTSDRGAFVDKYRRTHIMNRMADDIARIGAGSLA